MVQPWVTFGVLPLFALLNAGVAIDAPALRSLPKAILSGSLLAAAVGFAVLLTIPPIEPESS